MRSAEQYLMTGLRWLPSLIICLFYVPNAWSKLFYAEDLNKVISNTIALNAVGVILLVATILFLLNKTMLWGTAMLSLYMTGIVFIHILKGKPYEVAMLIVMATVFAAYLRKANLFIKVESS